MTSTLSRAAACCALALSLAACGTTSVVLPPDATPLDRQVAQVCTNVTPAYLAFTTYDLIKPVGEKTRSKVDAAYAVATGICANPPRDAASALLPLNSAIVTIRNARRAA